jgi:hypothetical protein
MKSMRILITPNHAAPYDQRMVNGLAAGFHAIGHQAKALPAPISPIELAKSCDELSIDVVIQVNRTRDPEIVLPPKVRYISWYQDVFPETAEGFSESFHESDILYALGDPFVLGLNVKLPCFVGSLVSGVDHTVINHLSRPVSNLVDFSLCGYIPPPLAKRMFLRRYLQLGEVPYITFQTIMETVQVKYRPLRGELDIHEMISAIQNSTSQLPRAHPYYWRYLLIWLSRLRRSINQSSSLSTNALEPFERTLSYFARDYPRMLDRMALIDNVLQISDSLELYGPGWDTHPNFRKYAKGIIDAQDKLLNVYCHSRINLANNTHGLGLHSRNLECMAVGGFVLTHESPHDSKPGGMLTSFEPGVHYGVFTPENLQEEAQRWLADEAGRVKAGQQAAEVVRQRHCWYHRAQQILDDLNK